MQLIIIPIGVLLILVGVGFHKKHKHLQSICTSRVAGEVIGNDRRENTETETDAEGHRSTRTSVTYYPVFRYTLRGRTFEPVSSTGTGRPRFTEGQAVTVCYDPDNPEQFYIEGDKAPGRFGIFFALFGAAVTIIGIVAIFVPMS